MTQDSSYSVQSSMIYKDKIPFNKNYEAINNLYRPYILSGHTLYLCGRQPNTVKAELAHRIIQHCHQVIVNKRANPLVSQQFQPFSGLSGILTVCSLNLGLIIGHHMQLVITNQFWITSACVKSRPVLAVNFIIIS